MADTAVKDLFYGGDTAWAGAIPPFTLAVDGILQEFYKGGSPGTLTHDIVIPKGETGWYIGLISDQLGLTTAQFDGGTIGFDFEVVTGNTDVTLTQMRFAIFNELVPSNFEYRSYAASTLMTAGVHTIDGAVSAQTYSINATDRLYVMVEFTNAAAHASSTIQIKLNNQCRPYLVTSWIRTGASSFVGKGALSNYETGTIFHDKFNTGVQLTPLHNRTPSEVGSAWDTETFDEAGELYPDAADSYGFGVGNIQFVSPVSGGA